LTPWFGNCGHGYIYFLLAIDSRVKNTKIME
jgi:hypothetical protein